MFSFKKFTAVFSRFLHVFFLIFIILWTELLCDANLMHYGFLAEEKFKLPLDKISIWCPYTAGMSLNFGSSLNESVRKFSLFFNVRTHVWLATTLLILPAPCMHIKGNEQIGNQSECYVSKRLSVQTEVEKVEQDFFPSLRDMPGMQFCWE